MFYPTIIIIKNKFQYEYNKKEFEFISLKNFVLGDFKDQMKEEIPLSSEKWKHFIKYIGKILKRAYEVICVDGNQGFVVFGVIIFFICLCYFAQGYFSKKLNEYLNTKKLLQEQKKKK